MKRFLIPLLLAAVLFSCKRDKQVGPTSSLEYLFSKNAPAVQTYEINPATGDSFTTPQGTKVIIPPNAFLTAYHVYPTGNVTIQFKDLYKKSDMLFSGKLPVTLANTPLKSAGEFYIRATYLGQPVYLMKYNSITIVQPAALTGGKDTVNKMSAFRWANVQEGNNGWVNVVNDMTAQEQFLWQYYGPDSTWVNWVTYNSESNYVFSLFRFSSSSDSGSWSNSDNASYFSNYPNAKLTIHGNESIHDYNTAVFLIFKDVSAMVHVYDDGTGFPYDFAPVGLSCTVVAVGVKDGNVYSAFVPITIGNGQTVTYSLSPTTEEAFKAELKALD